MKGIIKKIATGALFAGLGAGVAVPLTYGIAFEKGRESAKPVEVTVRQATGPNYRFLEGLFMRDAKGEWTSLYEKKRSQEIVSEKFPEDGSLITSLYR